MTTGRPPHSEGLQLTDITNNLQHLQSIVKKKAKLPSGQFQVPIRPLPIRVPHEPAAAPCRRSRTLTSSEVLAAESPAEIAGHGRSESEVLGELSATATGTVTLPP